MEILGICILVSTFIACDTWLFIKGYKSVLHEAKTPEEKAIRADLISSKKD